MKAIRILIRSIRDSVKSVFRNFSLSIASIACTTITLILVAISLVLSFNVNKVTKELEHELTIVVYLNKEATEEQQNILKEKLNTMDNVESYVFKSKDEWKLEMKNSSETLNTTLEYLDENPLLDSFIVTVKDVNFLKETSTEILENDFVHILSDLLSNAINACCNTPSAAIQIYLGKFEGISSIKIYSVP